MRGERVVARPRSSRNQKEGKNLMGDENNALGYERKATERERENDGSSNNKKSGWLAAAAAVDDNRPGCIQIPL